MLNQLVLVGRLVKKPELRESDSKTKYAYMTLAVPRSFKNADGKYDTDFIDCVLWDVIASNATEYCKKGDIVGVRGRLQTRIVENEKEKHNQKVLEVICEKITFLSSKNNNGEMSLEETDK